jgi:hypothetical protein
MRHDRRHPTRLSHQRADGVRAETAAQPRSTEHALLRVQVTAQLATLMTPYAEAQRLQLHRDLSIGCEGCGFYAPDLVLLAGHSRGQVGHEPLVAVDLRLPGDATTTRFDFYMAHAVDEAVIADPTDRSLVCYPLKAPMRTQDRSATLGLELGEIATLVSWPEID